MDEASWEFLCNNSPRLVEKQRPKTPSFFPSKAYNQSIPKLLPCANSKIKASQQPVIMKNSLKDINRDKTPPIIIKSTSRALLKPAKQVHSPITKEFFPQKLSPLRSFKRSGLSIKKVIKE